jgi:hypothetical protein
MYGALCSVHVSLFLLHVFYLEKKKKMKQFIIQVSLELTMQVLGIDAWDLLDSTTTDGLVEAIWWLLFLCRGVKSSTLEVVEYYLEE